MTNVKNFQLLHSVSLIREPKGQKTLCQWSSGVGYDFLIPSNGDVQLWMLQMDLQ